MKSDTTNFVRNTLRSTIAIFLAGSTLALAQQQYPPVSRPQTDPAANQQTTSSGGWKRVGDSNNANSAALQNPPYVDGQQQDDPNQPPPLQGSAATPQPMSQAPYSQPTNQQGYGNSPYSSNGPQGYGQQGYGQANGQQRSYPAPPPVPAQLTIQAGTYITVRVNQLLSSDKNQPGDAFIASLVQPLVVNGVVVAEPGQTLGGRVATAEKHHFDRPARLGLQLTNLTLVDGQQVPVNTQFISRTGTTTPGGVEAGTVAATTGVGALIGAAAGWGTGAAIGAGAGAAVGLIGVLITHNHASVIYPEQVLTFRIEAPVAVSTVNATQAFRYVEPNEYDRPDTYGPQGGYGGGGAASLYAGSYPAYGGYGYPYAYGGYPYYGYGYGNPFFFGPSFGFYGGFFGGRYYGGRYYGSGYYRGGYGGGYVGARGFAGSAAHVSGGAAGHSGGGHR